MIADEFPRAFATAFGAQAAAELAELIAEDGIVLTLTGVWADGRAAAKAAFEAEFSGIFVRARLVTGKSLLRPIGPGAAVIHQRYVVTGAVDETLAEMPRFGAMLTVVLLARMDGWQASSLTFSALTQ